MPAWVHDHALGRAGGAGGVDDIGRVLRSERPDALGVRRVVVGGLGDCGATVGTVEQDERRRTGRQPALQGDRRQHQRRFGVPSIWASRPGG